MDTIEIAPVNGMERRAQRAAEIRRRVVTLFNDGMTYTEIMEAENMTFGQVAYHLRQARARSEQHSA